LEIIGKKIKKRIKNVVMKAIRNKLHMKRIKQHNYVQA
jgi:hypothetical protein